jgi:DNA repair protein RadA
MDPQKILDNIIVARAYNSAHQTLILEEVGPLIKEHNIKLIIVDSAVGLFRAEYLGRGTLSTRQQKLNHFVHLLSRIAETYNCVALATNQVMSSPDVFFGDPTRPIGGNVVAHTSTYRIYFKKSGKKRIARMVDSPHHPEEEVIFALGEAGVMDPEEAEKKTKKTVAKKETKKTTKETSSKEKVETPVVEIPEITNSDGQELATVEIPEITNSEEQELTTVETYEDLALSEALDEEFSDSAPTDV